MGEGVIGGGFTIFVACEEGDSWEEARCDGVVVDFVDFLGHGEGKVGWMIL